MDFNKYQELTALTQLESAKSLSYLTLGLAGEAGEIANKVKKIIRDNDNVLSDEQKKDIAKEIGDVLWYCARLSAFLDHNLSDVAAGNLEKLMDRQKNNKIQGSGDNR
jgi:NTP pyrophosphatase (non-canonical NTP hydrolase)